MLKINPQSFFILSCGHTDVFHSFSSSAAESQFPSTDALDDSLHSLLGTSVKFKAIQTYVLTVRL